MTDKHNTQAAVRVGDEHFTGTLVLFGALAIAFWIETKRRFLQ